MDGAWESAQGRLERVQRNKSPPPPGIEAQPARRKYSMMSNDSYIHSTCPSR